MAAVWAFRSICPVAGPVYNQSIDTS